MEIEQILRLNNANEREIAIAFNAAEWQKEQNVPSPTHRARKSHPVILTILILLLSASGAGAYIAFYKPNLLSRWMGKNPEPAIVEVAPIEPTLEPIVVVDETANWKVYKNEKYEFALKYPERLNTVGIESESSVLGTVQNKISGIHIGSLILVPLETNTLRDIATSYPLIKNVGEEIGTGNANVTIWQFSHGGGASYALISDQDNELRMFVDGYSAGFEQKIILDKNDEVSMEEFPKILSTFRFTATSTTATSTPTTS